LLRAKHPGRDKIRIKKRRKKKIQHLYFIAEKLALLARSEIPGFAMGCWNNGMLEYWVWRNEIGFYMDDTNQKMKSDQQPLVIPNIPF